MTLEGAKEFAAALRDDGIAVLRLENDDGERITGEQMFTRERDYAKSASA